MFERALNTPPIANAFKKKFTSTKSNLPVKNVILVSLLLTLNRFVLISVNYEQVNAGWVAFLTPETPSDVTDKIRNKLN